MANLPTEGLSHKLTSRWCACITEAPVLETISAFYFGYEPDSGAYSRRGACPFTLSPVRVPFQILFD